MLIKKSIEFYKKHKGKGLTRKILFYLNKKLTFPIGRVLRSRLFFNNSTVIIGRNVIIHGLSNRVFCGMNVNIYDNVIIEFGSESELVVGDNCLFSYGVVIAVNSKIKIGNDVQIGEYTSIRDTTHRYDRKDVPMKIAGDTSDPISIGNNVWIGRGCLILPGTIIEDGVVIGANSVVKGALRKDGIYAGNPCQFIKLRF
ncbi:MAG TPA: acyltransferase [Saprospiraceae bacterium]|nr:acyltransferase [Saprospiraceae bacterium]HNT19446.1 acyltransferase [Saprospiraceae bacterium]